jgi:DnaA family protein
MFPQFSFDFRLRNEFTIDNFLACEANHELINTLKGELQHELYLIWGAHGCGKSHLLQASCAIHKNAVYLPLADYVGLGESVLDGLEQLDLVCIDDIQEVLGSTHWEEKLFALYHSIQQAGSRLLIASNTAPTTLTFSLPDLKSRFAAGMVYHLHELDDAQKLQALKIRAQAIGMPLEDEILQYICVRAERSTHHLFQLLDELAETTLNAKKKLSIPFIKSLMRW